MRLKKDVICGLAITGAGIILYVEAARSIGKLGYDVLDSPFFPKLGAVMLILFGAAFALGFFWKLTKSKKMQVDDLGKVASYIAFLVLYSLL